MSICAADEVAGPTLSAEDLPTVERMAELLRRLEALDERLATTTDDLEATKEDNARMSLRNKMLIEMLAVSQLDTGRAL